MKKILAMILCAVMLAAFAGCGSGNTETKSADATAAQTTAEITQATRETLAADVKTQLDEALSKEKFRGVVQITKGDDVVYQYVNGDDDNGKPLTIDASMPVGSVSKQFCAACVMLLSEQNKLSVDDTLDKYFPDYKYGKKMTIKQLLYMSSGLPNYLEIMDLSSVGANEADNINAIKKAIFNEELHFEPGDDYEYSNSNFFLLADIVSQVSGEKYHDYLRKNFLDPLEMTHTGFIEEIPDNNVWTSALSKSNLQSEEFFVPGLTMGAGDVVSNAADMDKWMKGLSGGKVISAETFKQMTENVNPNSSEDYCYGLWHMAYNGVGHVGQIPPHFGAVDYLNPERGVYIFAASNNNHGMSYVQQLPQTVLNIMFGEEQ